MAKSAMPVSKAKTAYELLSEIRKLILEEPKRYNQTSYVSLNAHGRFAPACGTVGCVAGWINVLHGDPDTSTLNGLYNAADIIGITSDDLWELFDSEAAGDRSNKNGVITSQSLTAHAKRGEKHIAKFQQKYAKQLKAKRV